MNQLTKKKTPALDYLKTLSKKEIFALGRRWNNKGFTKQLIKELK